MTTLVDNLVLLNQITNLCNFVNIPASTYVSTDTNQACRTSKVLQTNCVSVTNPETFTVAQTIGTVTTPQIQSAGSTISIGNNATTLNMLNTGTLTMNGLLQYPQVNTLTPYSYQKLMLSNNILATRIQRESSRTTVANTLTPISFSVAFSVGTTPVVIATANGGSGVRVNISAITKDGFTAICSGTSFNWIALGS